MEVKCLDDIKINLSAVRVNAKMNQKEWAKALGVSGNTVNNWENGRVEPSLTVVRKMSELSGIPIGYIFFEPQSKNIGFKNEKTHEE